jgi:hypothetical protein
MVINAGHVKGPPGPGYENAVILEGQVAQLAQFLEEVNKGLISANEALGQKVSASEKGASGGVASLDGSGKVPASQLPSFVDDVLEFANLAAFPLEGEAGKVYVAKNTNKTYRWSGSVYTIIGGDISLGENESTAYPGSKGKENAENIAILQETVTLATGVLAGATGAIESLNTSKVSNAEKAQPNGIPTLDENGKVPESQLPALIGSGNINCFGFEVRSDGCLWMVAQDGTTLPEAWIDGSGDLHLRFGDTA